MFARLGARASLAGAFALSLILAGCQEPGGAADPAAEAKAENQLDAPQVSTELDIVRAMIELADVREGELVVDLGSGDGRIPIMAARSRGAQGLGIEIDPNRIEEARRNAAEAGVEDRVTFRQQDLFATPLQDVDVLTLYLLPEINLRLRPKILRQMEPGTRVVSNSWDMGEWRPDRRQMVGETTIFLWIVPARVEGRWRFEAESGAAGALTLEQRFQDVSGTLTVGGDPAPLSDGRLVGDRIGFSADLGEGRRRYEGRVEGDRIVGDGWRAVRIGGG